MDSKNKYLDFYKENFGQGKYCSKSWGLASYEAGQQSKQAQINKALELLRQPMQGTVADLLSELEDILNDT